MSIPITIVYTTKKITVSYNKYCPLCWKEITVQCNNGGCDE